MSKVINLNYVTQNGQQTQRKVLDVSETLRDSHSGIVSHATRLILSSSQLGSAVVVSGGLIVGGPSSSFIPVGTGPGTVSASLMVQRHGGAWGIVIQGSGTTQADIILMVSGGLQDNKTIQHTLDSAGNYNIRSLTDAAGLVANLLCFDIGTSFVGIGNATPTEKLHIDGGLGITASLNGISKHLTLSSSAGSLIRASGTFVFNKENQSALPANSIAISGGVVWVEDKKCLAVYTPQGWFRLLSGTL